MLCYQYAIFSYIIRCGITDHISRGECMSGLWELISYDQYAMFRYLVKKHSTVNKKVWVAMITESLTGISP